MIRKCELKASASLTGDAMGMTRVSLGACLVINELFGRDVCSKA